MNRSVFVVAAIFGAMATACQTVVRENIISSIETGVGATLAENKQTQLYEFKVGYIRSQGYSIPTGKMILYTKVVTNVVINADNETTSLVIEAVAPQSTNAANVTPNVVAGIRAKVGIQDIVLGQEVTENFAVGDLAVNSSAATAMYIAQAQNSNSAAQAARAVESVANQTQRAKLPLSSAYAAAQPDKKADFDAIAAAFGYSSFAAFILEEETDPKTVSGIAAALKKKGLVAQ